jgi:predicted metal-dependent phosphotriesterase family hydrolase
VVTRNAGLAYTPGAMPRLRRKGVDDAGPRRLLGDNPARAFVFA